ncbi:MAG TPA: glycosyltransferase family 4 protein [Acidimicrobiales bacterium]|nr:glycosyltransferase family 4 protein [Acidimicrobiales bacterium]
MRATFVCEGWVGHTAFARRIEEVAAGRSELDARCVLLTPEPQGVLEHLPPFSRIWTARASLRTRRLLDRSDSVPDALFFNTVAPALLSRRWLRRVPSVICLDATPANVDEMGAGYGHGVGPAPLEAAKTRLYRAVLSEAVAVVAWSEWAKRSLVADYGLDPDRVSVHPPGAPLDRFQARPRPKSDRVRILFVGGDFVRKGGPELLRAFEALPAHCRLDVVTTGEVEGTDRVHVHRGLGPDDPALVRLFEEADIFALPTRADTWGLAVAEAMAAGLPVVTTAVGAVPELVTDGVQGLVVPPGDAAALTGALLRLVDDEALRARLGAAGRQRAVESLDGRANMGRIVDLVVEAGRRPMVSR